MNNSIDHNTSDDYKCSYYSSQNKVKSSDMTENYQCNECYSCFQNNIDLLDHLKLDHPKWYPERECKFKLECYKWKSGKCQYNHYLTDFFNDDDNFIIDRDYVDGLHYKELGFCIIDNPRGDIRCNRQICTDNHFKSF